MKLQTLFSILISSALFVAQMPAQEPPTIYLAGPLFTVAERQFNARLADELRRLGYTLFIPQEGEPRAFTARALFEMDVEAIDKSQLLLAIFDGSDPDSGTCWECGYAYAHKKPILALRTDFRSAAEGTGFAPYNIMLSESASEHIHLSSLETDFPSLVKAIDQVLSSFVKTEP